MGKVLVAYFSQTGNTGKMAEYIAEGIRFSGQEATVKDISDIKSTEALQGYDGYILGSPTYLQNLPEPMQRFLSLLRLVKTEGKPAGAFSTYTHDVGYIAGGQAAEILLETLQSDLKMKDFELGPFKLREAVLSSVDGMRACQDYGREFGKKLGD
jgi:flavodoxin